MHAAGTARPSLPMSFGRADLQRTGFAGWQTWSDLRRADFRSVPNGPVAYVIYRPADTPPQFLGTNPGGRFKGKDPTVPIATLEENWVSGAKTVYIGKADMARRRLGQYGRFGAGESVGHWGGRLIWQLSDAADLLVAWHPISWEEAARDYEKRLLAHFSPLHRGARPFANLTG
jgi:hypothetical protein